MQGREKAIEVMSRRLMAAKHRSSTPDGASKMETDDSDEKSDEVDLTELSENLIEIEDSPTKVCLS